MSNTFYYDDDDKKTNNSMNSAAAAVAAEEETTEDTPIFRSVSMPATGPTLFMQSRSASLPPSYEMSKETQNMDAIENAKLQKQMQQFQQQQQYQQNQLLLPINKKASPKSTFLVTVGWHKPNVTRLGLYHPLEVCHVPFPRDCLVQTLERLTHVFYLLSLRTKYHESPCSASCETMEQVAFRVAIWEDRCNPQKYYIEIQRQTGDSSVFCDYAKKILDVVCRGNCEEGPEKNMPVQSMQRAEACLRYAHCQQQLKECPVTSALHLAHHLCHCERYDSRQLGLESLCILTDCQKTGLPIASATAKCLLSGKSTKNECCTIAESCRERIIKLMGRLNDFVKHCSECEQNDSMEVDSDCLDFPQDSHAYMALVTLANSLSVLAQVDPKGNVGLIRNFLESAYSTLQVCLVECFIRHVRCAAQRPHLAYYSVKALRGIIILPECRSCVCPGLIEMAQQVGASAHAALEEEAKQLLITLRQKERFDY